jgi:hypothetical protein
MVSTKKGPLSVAEDYEYRQGEGGFPILASIVRRSKSPDTGLDTEMRYEFKLRFADVPENDFTLSAFGFSEPVGMERGFPWYVPLGIVGVALIVVAVLLRVWVRRRKAA